ARSSSTQGHLIGMIGTKGGVGTTTIGCALAAELRRQTGQKVLLADLDPDGGNAAFLAGIDSKYSIADATGNLQSLDRNFWESMVAKGTDEDLHLIASGGFAG